MNLSLRLGILAAAMLPFAVHGGRIQAASVMVDADSFAAGSVISDAFPGVTLRSLGSQVISSAVFAQPSAQASTGAHIFGNDWGPTGNPPANGRVWRELRAVLRADFAIPAYFVSIDVIADGTDFGLLEAYTSGDMLIERVETAPLAFGSVETLSISSPTGDIAYIVANGKDFDAVQLDNLHVVFVPEPSTLLGVVLGAMALLYQRAR